MTKLAIPSVAAIALAGGVLCERTHGQCDFDVTAFHLPAFGPITAMTVFDDGSRPALVIGGDFAGAGGVTANNVAKWDGSAWSALGQNLDDNPTDLAVFNGALYASTGDEFAARWTGAEWVSASEGVECEAGPVSEFVVFDDGSGPCLFAAAQTKLYRYDGATWKSIAEFDDAVARLELFDHDADGQPSLFTAGSFTAVDGTSANRIARWDGQIWSTLGEGVNGPVRDLVVHQLNDEPVLCLAGAFSTAGGSAVGGVAAWNAQSWTSLPENFAGSSITGLAVWDDGTGSHLYMSRTYEAHREFHATVHRFDGRNWTNVFTWRHPLSVKISALMPFDDQSGIGSVLYVGGRESTYGSIFARITPTGVVPPPGSPLAVGGTIRAFTAFDDGAGSALYAGGEFILAGNVIANNIARWDGRSWSALGSGITGQNTYYSTSVHTVEVFDDGSGTGPALYAGGNFNSAGGIHAYSIARWNGANWSPVGDLYDSTVHALAVFDDGTGPALYAGGSLGSFNGVPLNNIAKWDGLAWEPVGGGVNGGIYALKVFDDGSGLALYAGGWMTSAGSTSVQDIARWDGQSWSNVGGGMTPAGHVQALAVYDDQMGKGAKLFAGGTFTHAGGTYANTIAQWDGSSWSAVGDIDALGDPCHVRAMTVFDDGNGPALYATSVTNGGLARWNGNFWASAANYDGGIRALQVSDGMLYLGAGGYNSCSGWGYAFSWWSTGSTSLAISDQATEPDLLWPDHDDEVHEGDNVALWVEVDHGGAVAFQWRRDGLALENTPPFSGVMSNRLIIEDVTSFEQGAYDVVITNDCTAIVSEPVVLDLASCLGDIVPEGGDGVVNVDDLLLVIDSWGWCIGCSADIWPPGSNTLVNVEDLLTLLNTWGPCD
jgi:hypothetical protein